jgi:acyl-CoA hydrolase
VQYVSDDHPQRGTLTPSYARVSLAIITANREANLLGNVHGGEIMKLADTAAGAVAQRHSGGPAVTAALDEMAFLHPVHVGDIVHTHAQVNWAGRSSMEIGVRVETEPWTDASGTLRHVASAYFVFVAIDEDGRPRHIPGLTPETPDDVRRMREAEIRRAHRLAKKQEITAGRSESLGT